MDGLMLRGFSPDDTFIESFLCEFIADQMDENTANKMFKTLKESITPDRVFTDGVSTGQIISDHNNIGFCVVFNKVTNNTLVCVLDYTTYENDDWIKASVFPDYPPDSMNVFVSN